MFIGGLQKFTMLDYPGKISAVVFTMGCNFRCPYCHNPEIVDPRLINYDNRISEEEILEFLESRKDNLEGVCITGGEPTLQLGLKDFISKVKEMGFSVKLDTNASHFNIINDLVENDLVDYWAIDIKTSPRKYKIMTKKNDATKNLERSIDLITNTKSELELRTTAVPGFVNQKDFDDIADWINGINKNILPKLSRYSIQAFRPEKTLHEGLKIVKPYSKLQLNKMAEKMRKYCGNVVVAD